MTAVGCSSGSALNREQQLEYHIGGVSVKFPCKAYPTQVAMMAKIINALTHKENALLESPTGSGKSLALLCSALAWQRRLAQQAIEEQTKKLQDMQCACDCHVTTANQPSAHTPSLSLNQAPSTSLVGSETTSPHQLMTQTTTNDTLTPTPTVVSRITLPRMILSPGANDNTLTSSLVTSNQIAATDSSMDTGGSKQGDCVTVKGDPVKEESVKDVIMLNDSLEEDFKVPRKRLRTPNATAIGLSKSKKMKGVVYEDVPDSNEVGELPPDGHPTWKMECATTVGGVATQLGISLSQIMDTGLATNNLSSSTPPTTATSTASVIPPRTSCVKCHCQPVKLENTTSKDNPINRMRVPKIFFGTRTHKQISQITHEMARTAYNETPMTILASREHTCVHPQVSTSKNKNDDCKKLLDYDGGVSCSFYHRLQQKMGSQAQLRQLGYSTAWDIEDLVKLGKRVRACPYFATRALVEDANIIFCPYNYLIDPMIRAQMMIDIQEKIIIFDEAHNMEDSAREAASLSITAVQLKEILKEIQDVLDELNNAIATFSQGTDERRVCEELKQCYLHLQALGRSILRWIDAISPTLPSRGYEQAYGIWNGHDFLPILDKDLGLTPMTLEHYQTWLAKITEELKSNDKDSGLEVPSIPMSSLNVFKSLLIIVGYLFKDDMKYLTDYRVSLMKMSTMARKELQQGEWMSKRKRRSRALEKVWTFSLNFWCLNPAVAFSDLNQARSIILTSGTLSPMSSFSSELGVAFPIQLEANHVIPLSQTWVHSISHGPNGRPLNSKFQHSETFDFQDELGEAILKVCQTVPHGVLCFLSSYNMLEKLTKRWQETGLWYRILKEKLIVSEPRSGSKADFEAVMSSFYDVIEESTHMNELDDSEGGSSGALFLAVCRGKVSEGLDFANNNARAVITVGIPFPYLKDKQVELKREYNNEHTHKRGLLTGSEWYEIQAYRALNQALGRCIRHKKDWGALILIDERYAKGPHYTKGLSKWVRQRISHMSDFCVAMNSLQGFVKSMVSNDALESSSTILSLVKKSPPASVSMATSMCSPCPSHPFKLDVPMTPSLSVTTPLPLSPAVPLTSTPHTSQITTRVLPITNQNEAIHAGHTKTQGNVFSQQKMEEQKLFHNSGAMASSQQVNKNKQLPVSSLSFDQLTEIKSSFEYSGRVGTKVNNGRKSSVTESEQECIIVMDQNDITNPGGNNQEELVQPVKGDAYEDTDVELDKLIISIASTPPPSPPVTSDTAVESPVLFEAIPAMEGDGLTIPAMEGDGLTTPAMEGDGLTMPAMEGDGLTTPAMEGDDLTTPEMEGDGPSTLVTTGDKDRIKNELSDEVPSNGGVADHDQTPPISPETCPPPLQPAASEGCDNVKGEVKRPTRLSVKAHEEVSFGQVKTRRANTRMAKRSSSPLTVVNGRNPARTKPAGTTPDDADFKPTRNGRTPLKLRNEHQAQATTSVCSSKKILCSCGNTIAESVLVEEVKLRTFLVGSFGSGKSSTISSCRLWKRFKGWNKPSKKKTVSVVIATSFGVTCATQKAVGDYNAVWDEKLEMCYSHLQCGCGHPVGVKVHSINSSHTELVGKVILHMDKISLK